MTYSVHTLQSSESSSPTSSPTPTHFDWGRLAVELWSLMGMLLLVLLALWVLWVMSLGSYSTLDAAWSTSGVGTVTLNRVGRLGAWVADACYFVLGFSVWWCVAAAVRLWIANVARWLHGYEWLTDRRSLTRPVRPARSAKVWRHLAFWLGLVLLLVSSASLEWSRFYRFEVYLPSHGGGIVGNWLGPLMLTWFGEVGSALVCIVLGLIGVAFIFRFSWAQLAERLGAWLFAQIRFGREKYESVQDSRQGQQAVKERVEALSQERLSHLEHPTVRIEPVMDTQKSTLSVKEQPQTLFNAVSDCTLPQVDLLDKANLRQEGVSTETLEMTSRLIEKKLKDFGVAVTVVLAQPGPVITRYEIEPATGVKGAQIVGLAKDLARSLSLVSIRVVEIIPGKNYMALELPNARRQTIKLSEILGSPIYSEAKSLLTMGLGKDIVGMPVVADLAKMPHVLVAGTTGSGKSVGINAMILSLLYKAEAHDVRLLMIDPKMLEMSVYEGIPHLLCPVVTDMKQAANGLAWCVNEMERRYKLLSNMGVRNLAGFNAKIDEARVRGDCFGNPFSLTPDTPEPLQRLPHIVVVIDELADLMMVVGKKIEELIARLAQKARAAGIHLILATQRPSVDVITGLIKANIPTRIAFQVSSKIDSRTILDQMGAEALLGMGDMLYMPSGTGQPIRVHGAFVSDDEVHRVVTYLKRHGKPNYIEGILEGSNIVENDTNVAIDISGGDSGEKDAMYDEAVAIVLKNRKASISLVQRHLKIGYNRAARLLEAMEKAGLIGSLGNNGQRDILVPLGSEG